MWGLEFWLILLSLIPQVPHFLFLSLTKHWLPQGDIEILFFL